jgi:hypothetical protein
MSLILFPKELVQSILCSKFAAYDQMELTRILWSYKYLKKSGVYADNFDRYKFEKDHPLNLLFTAYSDYKTGSCGINYNDLKIWIVPKLDNKYLVYTPKCEYLLLIRYYSCTNLCGSCDGTTSSFLKLAPIPIKYAIEKGYIQ